MRFRLHLPVMGIFVAAFLVSEAGSEGWLENRVLREDVYPELSRVTSFFTDLKFKLRGPRSPRNKIVIVDIDSDSLDAVGRWPWRRDVFGDLLRQILRGGPRVVGLDVILSQADNYVPEEMAQELKDLHLGSLLEKYDADRYLGRILQAGASRLVLSWASDDFCQPWFDSDCRPSQTDAHLDRFSFTMHSPLSADELAKTRMFIAPTQIAPLQSLSELVLHEGFTQVLEDEDGAIRRITLMMLVGGVPHPALPLEVARVGMHDLLRASWDSNRHGVERIALQESAILLPTNAEGTVQINFRGPSHAFTYISAKDILSDSDQVRHSRDRRIAGMSKTDLLHDAYVLVGVSALSAGDTKTIPFDAAVPGVEGNANVLDNILSNDFLIPSGQDSGWMALLLLMSLGALALVYIGQEGEAGKALTAFFVSLSLIGATDLLLFRHDHNWNTGFLYLEAATLMVITWASRQLEDEKKKKFLRSAFGRYVAPAVVDSIVRNPEDFRLGGRKKQLTIMFSDIRGFTTFSEKMDAKQLADFLNDYLGIMTDIVFAHGGTLDKYIGDAIMAFWGAPLDVPDHASQACKAACEMMRALRLNRERWKAQYDIDVNIGIGINTGSVSVGNMGSERSFGYTVIGDDVNLSSRLESATKAYGVNALTTRATLDQVEKSGRPLPPHRVLDSLKVKGKAKAVEIVELLDAELEPSARALFEEARQLYRAQKWDEAIEAFDQAGKKISGGSTDGPCEVFKERCKEFKTSPPGADWDGFWKMGTK